MHIQENKTPNSGKYHEVKDEFAILNACRFKVSAMIVLERKYSEWRSCPDSLWIDVVQSVLRHACTNGHE